MKTNTVVLLLSLLSTLTLAQTPDAKKKVESAIANFAKAADDQNTKALNYVLDKNFRLIMNQMFGSTETVVMSREAYLDKIEKKEFGGEKRELKIEAILINGKNASAKVLFKGSKMTFVSLLQLAQDTEGNWKLVNDMPTLQ